MDLVYIVVVLFIIVVIALFLKGKEHAGKGKLPYEKIDALFTPAERSFYGVLKQAVGGEWEIFGKVRLADVIAPRKGMSRSNWQKAFNRISAKHIDFVVCNKEDLSILCAIELDDKSHGNKSRRERDEFIESACDAAGLRLVRFPARKAYVIEEVRTTVLGTFLSLESVNNDAEAVTAKIDETEDVPDVSVEPPKAEEACPKCASPLVKKVAKRGTHAGKQFLACSMYPKCRHIQK